jgi:hypothetical protein
VEWLHLKKANANGGSTMCNLLSLVPYPKHAHFTSLTLAAKYWGFKWYMPLSKSITIT